MKKEKKLTSKKSTLECDSCVKKKCEDDKDCFGMTEQILSAYSGEDLQLARAASRIESRYYMKKTRLEEIILFSHEAGFHKLGIAFCIGLAEETKILCKFLRKEFEIHAVCCKACSIHKDILDLEEIDPKKPEAMCNPIGQAMLLNRAETELNLICGLCVGHDILFTKHSEAPVSTFIVKDRLLAHNPVGALYCRYLRKRLDSD